MRPSTPKLSPRSALWSAAGLGLLLAGCAAQTPKPDESALYISPEFGQALHQDIVAQIADPDAHYTGNPAPGSNGSRVALAQRRYVKGRVIPPPSTTTASVAIGGENGGGGNGGEGDSGPSAPPMPQMSPPQ
jgi:hypothetical protein